MNQLKLINLIKGLLVVIMLLKQIEVIKFSLWFRILSAHPIEIQLVCSNTNLLIKPFRT